MNENISIYNEFAFRTKRTENEYNNNSSNQKILLNYDVNNVEKEKEKTENNENINSNIKTDFINKTVFMNKNNLTIDSFNISDDNINNKYPNFQSCLQLYPKDDIEIPSIKYYNYIFSIGTPSN